MKELLLQAAASGAKTLENIYFFFLCIFKNAILVNKMDKLPLGFNKYSSEYLCLVMKDIF